MRNHWHFQLNFGLAEKVWLKIQTEPTILSESFRRLLQSAPSARPVFGGQGACMSLQGGKRLRSEGKTGSKRIEDNNKALLPAFSQGSSP